MAGTNAERVAYMRTATPGPAVSAATRQRAVVSLLQRTMTRNPELTGLWVERIAGGKSIELQSDQVISGAVVTHLTFRVVK
jgi:hypothetical protein